VAEFAEPAALLNNPNSQFAKMILAAASVNDQSEDSGVPSKVLCSEAKESSEIKKKLSLKGKRISLSESDDCNLVVKYSDSSDGAESSSYDNTAYQSNDSDEELSQATAL